MEKQGLTAAGAPAKFALFLPWWPYVLMGVLPLWVGMLLAGVSGLPLRPGVWIAASLAVAFIVAAAGAAAQALQPGAARGPDAPKVPSSRPGGLAYGFLAAAAALGLLLQFWWRTGNFTLVLGGLGLLAGYFSYAPPLQWQRRGWGEAAAALCFGLLPVATGLYLQCGHLLTETLLYGLPLSFAAFNVFLVNGFPGPADEAPGPRGSLAVRLGAVPAAFIYTIANILVIVGLLACLFYPAFPLPLREAMWALMLVAVVNQELIKRRAYRDQGRLKLLGRLTLALHLGLGAVFALMLWLRF